MKEKNLDYFLETSAKTGENVENAFIMAAKMLYKRHKEKIMKAKENLQAKVNAKGKKLRRGQAETDKKQKKCCGSNQ